MPHKNTVKIALAAFATTAVSFAATSALAGPKAPINLADVPDHKVAICHFPGHEDDFLITGRGFGCENQGGQILIISKKAAANGHKISDVPE